MLIWIVWWDSPHEVSSAEGFFTNESAANQYRDILLDEVRGRGLEEYYTYTVVSQVVFDTAEEKNVIMEQLHAA